jgi:hypothetical protein
MDRYGFGAHDKIIMTDYPERKSRVVMESHRLKTKLSIPPRSTVAFEFSFRAD